MVVYIINIYNIIPTKLKLESYHFDLYIKLLHIESVIINIIMCLNLES